MSTQEQIIEHVVLFIVKPDVDPSKAAAMIDGLNGLASLNIAVHVSAGELLRSKSSSSLTFTHILHCRFRSTEDLQTYYTHPDHLRVVIENIQPIINDILAVDWISNGATDSPKPGSVMRVTLWKLKEETEKAKFLQVIEEIKHQFKAIEHLGFGEVFSDANYAKEHSIGAIAVLPGPAELEALDSDPELVKFCKEKVKDSAASEIIVDYVFPGC